MKYTPYSNTLLQDCCYSLNLLPQSNLHAKSSIYCGSIAATVCSNIAATVSGNIAAILDFTCKLDCGNIAAMAGLAILPKHAVYYSYSWWDKAI